MEDVKTREEFLRLKRFNFDESDKILRFKVQIQWQKFGFEGFEVKIILKLACRFLILEVLYCSKKIGFESRNSVINVKKKVNT